MRTETNLKKVWFCADFHFYHERVIYYCKRPFANVEEMNEMLIKYWNDTVAPDDTVYCLGDFSMAFRPVEVFTKRLNGRKILIAGNHDFCHPAHKKSRNQENQAKWIQNYLDNGWSEVLMSETLDIPDVGIVNLNHLPYLDPSFQLRHDKHRPKDDGRWLLCGHVHEKWAERGKMINVGVDVRNFKPISLEEIVKMIKENPNGWPLVEYEDKATESQREEI